MNIMTPTKYLYDVEPSELLDLTPIGNERIKLARELLTKLQKAPLKARDDERISKVYKAINFWQDLLIERYNDELLKN
ncbi:hypothetical protein CPIN17260_1110 [Campylobacter pinnipediorum subsp. pinnipediorum]|uniref:hypothetical protein n=1 Tax=Campylobacter pinnipediorum TaxID=1965231 RepID=UPI000994CF3C|nr:hypothetical protein [Campylobacter pinnipediorum]AQW81399.1 hypothetical protein CPIN17260_1110 [Campylobacter pinnipediorum subsp. pinnipediorum]